MACGHPRGHLLDSTSSGNPIEIYGFTGNNIGDWSGFGALEYRSDWTVGTLWSTITSDFCVGLFSTSRHIPLASKRFTTTHYLITFGWPIPAVVFRP